MKKALLEELVKISPRRGKKEKLGADIIKKYFEKEGVDYITQDFETVIPNFTKAELNVDGEEIPCLGASFVSGKITNKARLSIPYYLEGIEPEQMIQFSPVCESACLNNFQNFPSVAISRDSFVKVLMGSKISGEVIVEKETYGSHNILVGNITNPHKIVFAHYDSLVGSGAVDNGAAVQVIFDTIVCNRDLLKKNLFVFAGSEEESFDAKDGGWGFEIFDREYKKIMDSCEEIIVLDGVGVTKPNYTKENVDWVLPIGRVDEIADKIKWMQNDQSVVMRYYHSEVDVLENLKERYIDEARELLESIL